MGLYFFRSKIAPGFNDGFYLFIDVFFWRLREIKKPLKREAFLNLGVTELPENPAHSIWETVNFLNKKDLFFQNGASVFVPTPPCR